MKKSLNKILLCGMISAITLSSSITSLAATWKQNQVGWWWQEDDGSYPANTWKEISEKWYYFEGSGYMAANKWIGNYYVGADGAWIASAPQKTETGGGVQPTSDGKKMKI